MVACAHEIKPNLVVEGDFEAASFSERHALASPDFATVVSTEDTLWQVLTSGGNLASNNAHCFNIHHLGLFNCKLKPDGP